MGKDMTVAEAARTFGLHKTTLHRWIARGVVEATRVSTRSGRTAVYLLDSDEVAAKADELDRLSAYMRRKPTGTGT